MIPGDDEDEETRELHAEISGAGKLFEEYKALYNARGPLYGLLVDGEYDPEAFRATGCKVTELKGEK